MVINTSLKFGFDTRQLHAGQRLDPTTGSNVVPIYPTTSYVLKNADHAGLTIHPANTTHIQLTPQKLTDVGVSPGLNSSECWIGKY